MDDATGMLEGIPGVASSTEAGEEGRSRRRELPHDETLPVMVGCRNSRHHRRYNMLGRNRDHIAARRRPGYHEPHLDHGLASVTAERPRTWNRPIAAAYATAVKRTAAKILNVNMAICGWCCNWVVDVLESNPPSPLYLSSLSCEQEKPDVRPALSPVASGPFTLLLPSPLLSSPPPRICMSLKRSRMLVHDRDPVISEPSSKFSSVCTFNLTDSNSSVVVYSDTNIARMVAGATPSRSYTPWVAIPQHRFATEGRISSSSRSGFPLLVIIL